MVAHGSAQPDACAGLGVAGFTVEALQELFNVVESISERLEKLELILFHVPVPKFQVLVKNISAMLAGKTQFVSTGAIFSDDPHASEVIPPEGEAAVAFVPGSSIQADSTLIPKSFDFRIADRATSSSRRLDGSGMACIEEDACLKYTIIVDPHLTSCLNEDSASRSDDVHMAAHGSLDNDQGSDRAPEFDEGDMIGHWFCDGEGDGLRYKISKSDSELVFEFFGDELGSANDRLAILSDGWYLCSPLSESTGMRWGNFCMRLMSDATMELQFRSSEQDPWLPVMIGHRELIRSTAQ